MTITALHAISFAEPRLAKGNQAGAPRAGKVQIETRNNGNYTIHCQDYAGAVRLRDTLALLCNQRTKEARNRPRVKSEIDYGKANLAGDPAYEERKEIFRAFD
jgi:hypothetical protein